MEVKPENKTSWERRAEAANQESNPLIEDLKNFPAFEFGQWSEREVFRYFLFLHHHRNKFETKSSRKSLKVFKQMAKFIRSRNSSQCRTHHQNVLLRALSLEDSINAFIETHPAFHSTYEAVKEQLLHLEDLDFCEDTSTVIKNVDRSTSAESNPKAYPEASASDAGVKS